MDMVFGHPIHLPKEYFLRLLLDRPRQSNPISRVRLGSEINDFSIHLLMSTPSSFITRQRLQTDLTILTGAVSL
jgi:hypothetical protein